MQQQLSFALDEALDKQERLLMQMTAILILYSLPWLLTGLSSICKGSLVMPSGAARHAALVYQKGFASSVNWLETQHLS